MGSLQGRRRRNIRILVGSIVTVLLVAGLLVVAVDKVAGDDRGELTVAPEPAPVTAAPAVVPVAPDAPIPSTAGISAAIGPALANPDLGKFSGTIADAVTGQVLWSAEPATPMVPASTTKILTVAAALSTLPADGRVTTEVVQGSRPGEVVLVGGGDPTITAKPRGENGYYPGAAHLADLVDQIRASGTPVDRIVVDTSLYAGPTMAQGWLPTDVPAGFITPTEPLMIDGGRSDPLVDESPRSTTPALDAGRALAAALGIDQNAVDSGAAAPGAAQVAAVQSAPLRDRLRQMMEHSDNVLAEAIGREVAMKTGAEPSFSGAAASVSQTLFSAGFDLTGLELHDTSGLSVDDRITAKSLDEILTAAAGDGHPKLRPMLDYLPVAGGTGSLADRYVTGNRVGAGWVRAKTGTLSGASALAGYVLDESGRVLTFTFMSNDRPPNLSRPALDALASSLRTCGCT
ncbi:D-alanyl-D-alanine carboxypeptidase/D-alanyl-D-alanine-endopeptidase [Rhodococcus sp. NPDC058521]|uniref:D-alanyl-D-alanine carboxypeptidase/D-alanyl-D-alanine endopeptidase n=1 Tax=Rhodococcus sp. NPDC058521 TaxID=3346536 RepID=UPI00364D6D7B